jgi:hypothetical protein
LGNALEVVEETLQRDPLEEEGVGFLVEEEDEELINRDQRRRLRVIMNMAIVRAAFVGFICGMIAFSGELAADHHWGEQTYVVPENSTTVETVTHSSFWEHALLKYGIGLVATVFELLHLYYDMMISVLNMTDVVKLQLYPLTPERSFLVQGFINVALEMGFSQLPNYGINPLRMLSKWRQYLIQLLYASKGGISKFLVKSALKRVLLRVGMRGAGSAVAFTNLLAVPVICFMYVPPPQPWAGSCDCVNPLLKFRNSDLIEISIS